MIPLFGHNSKPWNAAQVIHVMLLFGTQAKETAKYDFCLTEDSESNRPRLPNNIQTKSHFHFPS
jgi:hypothetical protein